jgi:hypothetical protein
MVCFKHIIVNTLYEGDNKDGNDNDDAYDDDDNNNKPVYEEGDVTVLWNQAVHTDTEFTATRADITIKNKKEKTCTLIDVAMPADRNVVQKGAGKKLKYKSLCIEIQRMWNL